MKKMPNPNASDYLLHAGFINTFILALLLLPCASSVAATTAVAPFVNATGRDDLNPLSYGIPDLLSAVLGNSTNLHVVDRSMLNAVIAEQGLSFAKAGASDSFVKVGKLINADTILTGSIMEADAVTVRIAVQVIEVNTAAILKSVVRQGAVSDLVALCEDIASAVGDVLAEGKRHFTGADIDNAPFANLYVMRGLESYWRGEYMLAVALFMRARDLHPRHRDAILWTARAYVSAEEWAHGFIELSRFAELFPDDPEMKLAQDLHSKCLLKMGPRERRLLVPEKAMVKNVR